MTRDTNRFNVSRRSLLAGVAALPFSSSITQTLLAQSEGKNPGLVIREKEPQNLESDFASLESVITPTNKFYIRSHFAVPTLEAKTWSLKIEGAVAKPLRLSY